MSFPFFILSSETFILFALVQDGNSGRFPGQGYFITCFALTPLAVRKRLPRRNDEIFERDAARSKISSKKEGRGALSDVRTFGITDISVPPQVARIRRSHTGKGRSCFLVRLSCRAVCLLSVTEEKDGWRGMQRFPIMVRWKDEISKTLRGKHGTLTYNRRGWLTGKPSL